MDVYGKLQHLYPALDDADVRLELRKGRVEITYWNTAKLGAQPDQAAIDAVTDAEADDAAKERQAKREIDDTKAVRALTFAIADNLSGKTRAQFAKEVRDIYKTL